MGLRGVFSAALAGFRRRGEPMPPELRTELHDERREMRRRRRKEQNGLPKPPVLPVMPFELDAPSAAALAHRANIDASRHGSGPFYTPKKAAP